MKFIFLNPHGGAVSGVFSYGKLLLEYHPDALMLSLNDDGTTLDAGKWGVRYHHLPFSVSHREDIVAKKVVEIAESYRNEPIILLPNNEQVAFYACLLAQRVLITNGFIVRILAIAHSDHVNAYKLAVLHEKQVAKIIGVSQMIADRIHQKLPWRGKDIVNLPYPVPVPSESPKTYSNQATPTRIIYPGRFNEEQKRVSRLPSLVEALLDLQLHFRFDLYGEGNERNHLEQAFSKLQTRNNIYLSINKPLEAEEIRLRMALYDIIVLVSAYEGTPISLLEAMAAGLCPIVMRLESGIPELIANGVNGFIVEQGDISGMASIITYLDRNREDLRKIKENARNTITRKHSLPAYLNTFDLILSDCISTPAPDSPDTIRNDYTEDSRIRLMSEIRDDLEPTVIWGGGFFGRSIADAFLSRGRKINSIIDSSLGDKGIDYRGIKIYFPEKIIEINPAQIIIGSIYFSREITDSLGLLYADAEKELPHIVAL